MSRFSIRYPYLIIVVCLMVCVIGVATIVRMPVDLFPKIKIPVVVVATFFSGMPPEQISNDITGRFERFFTLGSGIEHIESRSLPGVSLIKEVPERLIAHADADRIAQLFANLVSNARHHGTPGEPVIAQLSIQGDEVHFDVSNSAPPIAPEQPG